MSLKMFLKFRLNVNLRTSSCALSTTSKLCKDHKQTVTKGPAVDKDLELFLRDDVQTILKRICRFDLNKTLAHQKAKEARRPNYKLLTDEELEEEMQYAQEFAEQRLQMPPVMKERAPRDRVLSKDPDIAPAISSKYVFVDISEKNIRMAHDYSKRPVVVRHKNGELRHANWDVVDRVTQIYAPQPGRDIFMPRMFEEKNLEDILEPNKYVYILERACVQFEPDSGDFVRVTRRIYEHAFEHRNFEYLDCTRFFGPMILYFASVNKLEPLLVFFLDNGRMDDTIDAINLMRIMRNKPVTSSSKFNTISTYMKMDANKKYIQELEEAVKRYTSVGDTNKLSKNTGSK